MCSVLATRHAIFPAASPQVRVDFDFLLVDLRLDLFGEQQHATPASKAEAKSTGKKKRKGQKETRPHLETMQDSLLARWPTFFFFFFPVLPLFSIRL